MSDSNPMAAFGDFGKWVPGFEFLKGLSQGGSKAVPQMPSLGSWVAPTLNVEELDKRIQELRTVLFWLEQNSTALKATIQAMEVQKMTLATLQGMNVSLQDMAQAFSVPVPGAPAPAPAASGKGFAGLEVPPLKPARPAARSRKAAAAADAPAPAPAAAPAGAPSGLVDPMQWWGALTQQFQTIADTAMKEAKARAPEMAPGMKAATELAEQAGKTMAASAGQAGDMLSQALKTGAEAWTGSAAKAGRAKAPAKSSATPASAGRKAASKRSAAAPARKSASRPSSTAARRPR